MTDQALAGPLAVGPGLDRGGAALDRHLCPEEMDRVTATAADLFVTGRRVTERAVSALTGLDPDTVGACLDDLVRRQVLTPSGTPALHYLFAPNRWPGR